MDAAKSRRLPGNFLAKIFQRLARQGVLVSQRGPGGGYALARDPAAIRLLDIVLAVEDFPSGPRACLLEPRVCGVDGPCAIHAAVRRADRALLEALKKTTLADLGG